MLSVGSWEFHENSYIHYLLWPKVCRPSYLCVLCVHIQLCASKFDEGPHMGMMFRCIQTFDYIVYFLFLL